VTEPRKRTAAETWRALEAMTEDAEEAGEEDAEEDAKIDAEMERILSLSEDEVSRELADAGFDPADVRARGEAIGRAATAHEAPPDAQPITPPQVHPIAPRRTPRVRMVLLVAAALAVATALLMAGLLALNYLPDNAASPAPTPEHKPQPQEK
jgi:hypothetical protein